MLTLVRTHLNYRLTTMSYFKKKLFYAYITSVNIMLDNICVGSVVLRRKKSKRKFQNEQFLSAVEFEPKSHRSRSHRLINITSHNILKSILYKPNYLARLCDLFLTKMSCFPSSQVIIGSITLLSSCN